MKEKLIIKNFGPIKDVKLELSEINILIGEQSTGKSTVAKVLITVKNTIHRDLFYIPDDIDNRLTRVFTAYLKIAGIETYLRLDTEIEYMSSNTKFLYQKEKADIQGSLTTAQLFSYDFTYIPSERNLVFTLSDSLFALMETGADLPKLFLRFGDKFQKARKQQSSFDYESLLGINYRFENGKDVLNLSSGEIIPANTSSSGLQTAIAFLVVLDTILKPSRSMNLVVLEEPELNCSPATQQKIMNYIVGKIQKGTEERMEKYNCQLVITTHSPYILTSLNNILYAFNVSRQHPDETKKIIDENYWLDSEAVSAYMLTANGTSEDIFDREEKMIRVEKIDEISRMLNEQFDELLDVEVGQNN